MRIRDLGAYRLCVHRTPKHIYAQIISPAGSEVIASASTVQSDLGDSSSSTGNIDAARAVGRVIAERSKAAGVTRVAFDRAGFKFHGRVKALADAARENGLDF
jgi:large subunit ribosomal protein L18